MTVGRKIIFRSEKNRLLNQNVINGVRNLHAKYAWMYDNNKQRAQNLLIHFVAETIQSS